MIRLALYQPDIAQNTGSLLRLAACLEIGVDFIEPAGFLLGDGGVRRAGMDYLDHVALLRHRSWTDYLQNRGKGRLVLLTTRGSVRHVDAQFQADDTLILGRESAGVPDSVHEIADLRVRVPMRAGLRSLNVALAGAIVLGEALRQTSRWPDEGTP